MPATKPTGFDRRFSKTGVILNQRALNRGCHKARQFFVHERGAHSRPVSRWISTLDVGTRKRVRAAPLREARQEEHQ
jgi:hypothetical protein